jgi:hypothetical protein
MSQMVVEVYRAFKAANVPDVEAEAAAQAVAEVLERSECVVTHKVLREELRWIVTKEHLAVALAKRRLEPGCEIKAEMRSLGDHVCMRLHVLSTALAILISMFIG